MPKVSFRMASAYCEVGIRRTDQHGAENSSVTPHRGPVDHRAKRMLRTEGNGHRHTPSVQHSPVDGWLSISGTTGPLKRALARLVNSPHTTEFDGQRGRSCRP